MPTKWKKAVAALLVVMASAVMALDLPMANSIRPVRLAVVFTPSFSGLIADLVADFKSLGGPAVEVTTGVDIYNRARAGEADIVISHYGFIEVERFVQDGYGRWPRTVFANQMVIIGPKTDPAQIRGARSATDAFRRIAETHAPFIANSLPAVIQLTDYLWERAERPEKKGWFLDDGTSRAEAIKLAEKTGAYVIWGASPFLRFVGSHSSALEILFANDPILQRTMCTIVVAAEKVPGVNVEGAEAFQRYLLSPRAQSRVAAFREQNNPGLQLWWPEALHNDAIGAQ